MKDLEEHLSSELMDAYRQQRLRPAELIRVDDHLAGCARCRRRLEASLPGSAVRLHTELQAVADTLPDAAAAHLTFEQLSRCVDETLDRSEALFVTDHLSSCLQCEGAVNDLRAFASEAAPSNSLTAPRAVKQSLGNKVRALLWPSAPAPAVGWALAMLVLVILAGWMIRSVMAPKSHSPELADRGGQPTPAPSVAPSLSEPALTPVPETAPLLAQVLDGTGLIALDRQGRLSGAEQLPPAYQHLVKEALSKQSVTRPDSLEGLKRRGSSLMGGNDQGAQFSLLAPVGKVVFADRPTFRWTLLAGATAYVVEIYDEQFTLALKSEAVQRPPWTPSQPLARGRVYAWQVKATKDGQEVQAPKPPATQARFRVLAQPRAEEIARARRHYASSHLALGLLYAQAGLLDEAEQELRALRRTNPDSAVVRRLLAQVREFRR